MPTETECDASTGIYRCNDITAFKFRVHVRTVEASDLEQNFEDDKHEEQLFSWQQRVFSPQEVSVYSDLNNCLSPLQKNYHKQITETDRNSSNSKNILFSYLLPDILDLKLERDILLHQKKTGPSSNQKTSTKSNETPRLPKSFNSFVANDNLNGHSLENSDSRYGLMYIMADVGYLIEGEANEKIIIVLKWDSLLKVLSVFPDFNSSTSGPGYSLEGFSDACNQYVFWIVPEASHFQREMLHENKISEQYVFSPDDVLLPRHGMINVHVFGEIRGARYIDLENIFVRYHLELPNGWSYQSPDDSSGITQQAKMLDGFANFNHLFEMTLTYSNASSSDYNKDQNPDSWGRVGKEGCSWVSVPPISGQHNFRLQCWRPMQNLSMSATNSLKRYFIGGTPHLANMSFNGIPESFQGGRLSKFGVKEIATGELDVCLNIILHSQSSDYLSEEFSQSSFLDHFPALSLLQSVNIALKAFLWARKRIQTAITIE
ncbi:Meckel syndrome type 1 protein-like isoform X2 [Nilaparvata lugens]|uniref:Meckel syndrome type 1 protein-like isoform X2 n=1 Tax=Nilaparvata lugens TaxID=108931 RepID=UPI000B97EB5B|nr:Meckel syndrome type 1 protein-like isoform X2 [Nilaparvata lugens]